MIARACTCRPGRPSVCVACRAWDQLADVLEQSRCGRMDVGRLRHARAALHPRRPIRDEVAALVRRVAELEHLMGGA